MYILALYDTSCLLAQGDFCCLQVTDRNAMVQPAPGARYRKPPPHFTSEQKKSNDASELESSDKEKAHSSDEEDEDQCERVYQVLAQPFLYAKND